MADWGAGRKEGKKGRKRGKGQGTD